MEKRRRDAGFSLAAIVMFATVASIFIAAAVPVYQFQAKRELEEELIFRGGEYTRAIQKYRVKFGVYPNSIDQLLSANGLRFLRKAYKDPITGKDFRLLTLNPDGSINGSKVFQQNINTQPLFGNTAGGTQPGQQPFQSQQQNQQSGGFGAPGGMTTTSPGLGGFGAPQGQQSGLQQNQQQQQPQRGFQSTGNSFGLPGGGQIIGGGGIVGVASDSEKDSIKVYNNHQKYNEWEFVAIGQQGQFGPQGQFPGQVNPQRGGPGQNSPFGPSNTSNPFGGQQGPTNPFGPGQTVQPGLQNPLGGGQPTQQNPFGGGNTIPPGGTK